MVNKSGVKQGSLIYNNIHQGRVVEEWLHTMPIHFKALIGRLAFDLNCTIRINISHHKGPIHFDRNLPPMRPSLELYNNTC